MNFDKGKRALTDMDDDEDENEERKGAAAAAASPSEHSTSKTGGHLIMMQQLLNCCKEAGSSEKKLVQGTSSSLNFSHFLKGNGTASSEMEKSNESDEEMSHASVANPIISCRRGRKMVDLDLSLLSSTHSLDFFHTPPNASQPPQQSPFHGIPPLNWGAASPANPNAFRQRQMQQDHGQLTIFYGGAVNVYNVSADMAKAIMVLASSSGGNTKSAFTAGTPTSFAPPTPLHDLPTLMEMSSTPRPSTQAQPTLTFKTANLPISRKHSLQRFLEKRSHRLYARAPYAPVHQN